MSNDERPLIRGSHQPFDWSDCFCFGRCYARLDGPEQQALAHLRNKIVDGMRYEEAQINEMLLTYYVLVFPTKPVPPLTGPEWKTIGFQSDLPARDLRTGSFPVECMIYLAKHYAEKTQEMVRGSSEHFYPFSTTCLNIVQLLVIFFRLQQKSMSPIGCDAPQSSLEEIQAFARMCVAEGPEKAFHELFCACVARCHHEWVVVAKRGGNLMEFRSCLEITQNVLQEGLSDATTIDEITSYMQLV